MKWLIAGAGVAAVVLAGANVVRALHGLGALAEKVGSLPTASDRPAAPVLLSPLAPQNSVAAAGSSPSHAPMTAEPPSARLPLARPTFDADAMRAAIEADPSIGELVNDPDPAVRAAILAFFENE